MRWIVFDFGEVISQRNPALPFIASRLGVPLDVFEAAYWDRDAYDRGGSDAEYWATIGSALGLAFDDAAVRELTALDNAGWLDEPVVETVTLIEDLAALGVPLALLSNAPVTFARLAEKVPWAKHFRHLVFSGDLGCAKPDPEIFAHVESVIGSSDVLFFDDRAVNVEGARAVGWDARLWTSAAAARLELRAELGTELGDLGA
ncbi:putative hydrolase of the HAD superfamily [Lentzea xinjiangensis]|uniref:Putative hydrolase of the HAD superfamily n=1 Tax=Lentzea xinjiangensis TaxID=402600 RepID=A0A1H9AK91_9PSEU|nr:HAD-IA family hydrolase [Lentzea xinjiangensis]SEP76995.1 putative hydrolase of the HAD superfamily [Lentzea xinjiangensis]